MSALEVLAAGPAVTLQDLGRPGHMATGLSPGGAADRLALFEAAALLGLERVAPGLEMAGMGGRFRFAAPTRFALTGAPMTARLDGRKLAWQASHRAAAGALLEIGGASSGVYGYLTPAGGIAAPEVLGSRAAHLAVGIGAPLRPGDRLELLPDPGPDRAAMTLAVADRFSGGLLRLTPGPQSGLFSPRTRARFLATDFVRAPAGNRQGVRLDHDGAPFGAETTGQASEPIRAGDVQMTGDGVPYILLAECQTTGGYARIGSLIPADLPRLAQAPPGARLRFAMIGWEEADRLWQPETGLIRSLGARLAPLTRDPRDIPDLLGYQLISGVTSGGHERERENRREEKKEKEG